MSVYYCFPSDKNKSENSCKSVAVVESSAVAVIEYYTDNAVDVE